MFWKIGKRKAKPTSAVAAGKVLVLIDWDNLFICLYDRFKNEMQLEYRIKELMKWVQENIGEVFGGYGFVFAPEHLNLLHQQMCVKNNLRLFTCPKRKLQKPERNPKTGNMESEQDTVDETLMWFARSMANHPDVKFICLVSGDGDYTPMMRDVGKLGVKRVVVAPTISSLSKSKNLAQTADNHPRTGKKMLFRLDAF